MDDQRELRLLTPQWNNAMIAASIAISFLGAFTSTQLMCHARMSVRMSSVFAWSLLGSLIFGFCSIWSLHEVAMLACEFDVMIGIDAGLTILSAVFAVVFTFIGLSSDLLWDRWQVRKVTKRRKRRKVKRRSKEQSTHPPDEEEPLSPDENGSTPLLHDQEQVHDLENLSDDHGRPVSSEVAIGIAADGVDYNDFALTIQPDGRLSTSVSSGSVISKFTDTRVHTSRELMDSPDEETDGTDTMDDHPLSRSTVTSSDYSWSRRGSSTPSGSGSFSLGALGLLPLGPSNTVRNPFAAIATALYQGSTVKSLSKGFVWSIAVTSMHYVGILGLHVPDGYCKFNVWLVILSAIISFVVCSVGSILMASMETHLPQQILFSAIAAAGVACMHFTGMAATSFYSYAPATDRRGYPSALPNAVVGIAFATCITANVLLAHAATVSRNKLAEIVWTRKELWRAIAQRENAEAAARARSDFIASASHELRTPLHHLQGYSDLLAQEQLTGEGKKLLNSIQRALKTLSHITNNVLDWSKYERNTEGAHQPVALDIRQACESVIVLLPNVDEEAEVELYVVIAPDVPTTVFLDEDWIHRILMNLLSNALKFTKFGFILLSIEKHGDKLQAIVRDTGCGLDPEFIPQMWEPFKQGEVRGSARGTGLGLSIIKQLLSRMMGTVTVESKFARDESIGPSKSGTTFTVTVPLQSTGQIPSTELDGGIPNIAILAKPGDRSAEGVSLAWTTSGANVSTFSSVADVDPSTNWKYLWVNLDYLQNNAAQFDKLLRRKELKVLVPYETSDSLDSLAGILSAPNIVMLQKPLFWHTFEKRVAAADISRKQNSGPSRALRFATDVQVLNEEAPATSGANTLATEKSSTPSKPNGTTKEDPPKPKKTIMLVEDNPVNQKLGQKMLTALGYTVVVAADGQECIDFFTAADTSHQPIIDGILMDQSMPRKDGVTATAEIRALEVQGKLHGRIASRKGKGVVIVALTAVVNAEAKEQFREAGADDFLPKPLTLKRLREALEGHLRDGGEWL